MCALNKRNALVVLWIESRQLQYMYVYTDWQWTALNYTNYYFFYKFSTEYP